MSSLIVAASPPRRRMVLPWFALVMVIALTAALTVWWVSGDDASAPSSATNGFLTDAAALQRQAVTLARLELERGADPRLRDVARGVLRSRRAALVAARERGALRSTPIAMAWMAAAVPRAQQPGLASVGEVDRLRAADGAPADEQFSRLVLMSDWGELHLADAASGLVDDGAVLRLARRIAVLRSREIARLQARRRALGLAPVEPPSFEHTH